MRSIYQPFVVFMGIGLLLTCALSAPTATGEGKEAAPLQTTAARLYRPNAGPLSVAVQNVAIHDATQQKDLPLRVTFPKASGRYPLIVFSHGMYGSRENYEPLVKHWAGHGYVVIQPTHGDSLSLMPTKERRDLLKAKSPRQITNRPEALQHHRTRPKDVSFVLDSLEEIERKVDGLAGKIDRQRIGLGGHSFGAQTTLAIGGLAYRIPFRGKLSFADRRPSALLAISPPGPRANSTKDAYAAIDRPTLVVTGSNDKSPRTGLGPDWRRTAYESLPPGDKYFLFIDGAHHGFGGIAGAKRFRVTGPHHAGHVAFVRSSSLAFWDAYLKENDAAKQFLQSDQLAAATDGNAVIDFGLSRRR